MGFSQFAGTVIVPMLSRAVLAAAFISAGYGKFQSTEYTAAQASALESLGVSLELATDESDAVAFADDVWAIVPASFRQDGDPDDDQTGADQNEAVEPATETISPDSGAMYAGQRRHRITLLCADHEWPAPTLLSLLASVTELIGGVLLLVGFLTRIWSLGLAIAMGSAFYLVTLSVNGFEVTRPLAFAADHGVFHEAYAQLGLAVLALGLLCTGAGPLSVDRLLFGSGKRAAAKGPDSADTSEMDDGLG